MHRASLIVSVLTLLVALSTVCRGRSIKPVFANDMSLKQREASQKRHNEPDEKEMLAEIVEKLKDGQIKLKDIVGDLTSEEKKEALATLAAHGIDISAARRKFPSTYQERHNEPDEKEMLAEIVEKLKDGQIKLKDIVGDLTSEEKKEALATLAAHGIDISATRRNFPYAYQERQ
ncbi:hypothetical protein I4U23_015330 [Adineta vaga]|nr:hypothetical protein I4U23_015330 [Adineta vaga]